MSWAGVIAGGAAIAGGLLSSQGASQAADAAAQGSDRAIAEQRRQFDTILGLQQPGMVTGTGANNALARLYGLPYQEYQPPQSGQVTNALTGINGGSPGRTFNSSSFLGAGVGGAMFGLPGTLLGGSLFGGVGNDDLYAGFRPGQTVPPNSPARSDFVSGEDGDDFDRPAYAVVRGEHVGALAVGYCVAPVVVAMHPAFAWGSGVTTPKTTTQKTSLMKHFARPCSVSTRSVAQLAAPQKPSMRLPVMRFGSTTKTTIVLRI